MTQEILPKSGEKENASVIITDGQEISMQLVQDVYNEITGKNESLSNTYRLNHQTKFEDIQQLDIKINQLYEQYNIVERNCAITLYHIDDCKEVFSSFERFKLYDKSSMSPLENIRIRYNFLIALPNTKRLQSYSIELDIHSRTAIKRKAEKEKPLPKHILHIFTEQTARLEIEFIDYTVARNFQSTIDGWFQQIDQSKPLKFIAFIQNYTLQFPIALRYLSALFLCTFFYLEFPSWTEAALTFESQLKLAILCFGSVFILSGVAARIGVMLGRSIERLQPLSYLDFNKGDKMAISELQTDNLWSYVGMLIKLIATLGINILMAWIAVKIGISI